VIIRYIRQSMSRAGCNDMLQIKKLQTDDNQMISFFKEETSRFDEEIIPYSDRQIHL